MAYKLVVFLGNPGTQYARTRHNVGWMVADSLPGGLSWQKKFKGRFAKEGSTYLLLPETYMNKSGESVQACVAYFSLDPEEVLVVHDETELPLGTLQLKAGGGTAGHNGLKSLRERLGGAGFSRVRIGIGRPDRESLSSYVLTSFRPDEEPLLGKVVDEAARTIDAIVRSAGSPLLERLERGEKITLA